MLQPLWYRIVRKMCQYGFTLGYGIRVTGRHYVPATGGALLVANHQSFWDPMILGLGIETRQLHYMARESLFRDAPVMSFLMRTVNGYPVRVGEPDLGAIKETIRRVREGNLVCIMPEGTRTEDGTVGPLMPGFAMLARKCRVPVVPAAIDGAFEAWPRHAKLPRLGQIRVGYGPPIPADEVAATDAAVLTERMRGRIVELLEDLRRCNRGSGRGPGFSRSRPPECGIPAAPSQAAAPAVPRAAQPVA